MPSQRPSDPPSNGRDPFRLADRVALTLSEAAKAMGVCKNTLRRLISTEGLPVIRTGGVVLVPVDELRRWLSERASREANTVSAVVDEVLGDLEEKE